MWVMAGAAGAAALVGIDVALRAAVDSAPVVSTLVQVLPMADAPLQVPADSGRANPGERVVDQTFLGEGQAVFAYGALSDAGNVCLMVHDNNAGVSAPAACSTFEAFTRDGLHADVGTLQVSWFADGTVEWSE